MDIAPPGTHVFSIVGDGVGEEVMCSHVGVVEGAGVGEGEGTPVVGGFDGVSVVGVGVGLKVGSEDGCVDKDGEVVGAVVFPV